MRGAPTRARQGRQHHPSAVAAEDGVSFEDTISPPQEAELRAYLQAHIEKFRTPPDLISAGLRRAPGAGRGGTRCKADARALCRRAGRADKRRTCCWARRSAGRRSIGSPRCSVTISRWVAQPQPGHWVGPLRSAYGLHLVLVTAVEPATCRHSNRCGRSRAGVVRRTTFRSAGGPVPSRARRLQVIVQGSAGGGAMILIAPSARADRGVAAGGAGSAHEVRPAFLELGENESKSVPHDLEGSGARRFRLGIVTRFRHLPRRRRGRPQCRPAALSSSRPSELRSRTGRPDNRHRSARGDDDRRSGPDQTADGMVRIAA